MRKSAMLAGALSLAVAGVASADVYGPGAGGAIPDRGVTGVGPPLSTFTSTIAVPAGSVVSVNSVTITGLTHSWVGDLVASLTAPNGDNVHLFSRVGSTTPTGFGNSGDFNGDYTFVNSGGATMPLAGNVAPGTYNRSTNNPGAPPVPDLDDYTVFNGDPSGGNWTLTIEDWAGGDTGALTGWSLDVTIPEPGSLSLLAGCVALPLLRRRRH
jgi:hypothetical protein